MERTEPAALDLYPAEDFTDRALVRLDQATCLALGGDHASAAQHVITTLLPLTPEQRQGIIDARAGQVYKRLSTSAKALPPARELRDVLMLPVARKDTDPSC